MKTCLTLVSFLLVMLMLPLAKAGSVKIGFNSGNYDIKRVVVTPANKAGKFFIGFHANNAQYLIIDQDKNWVEFNYADASVFRSDVMKNNMQFGCEKDGILIGIGLYGCQLSDNLTY